MNKFNLPQRGVQKYRRSRIAVRKRLQSPHPSLKLPHKPPPAPISGKRQRKLQKQWRRAQKALESGLVTMQDIEMLAAETSASSEHETKLADKEETMKSSHKRKQGFRMKKQKRFRLKQKIMKGRDGKNVEAIMEDVMME